MGQAARLAAVLVRSQTAMILNRLDVGMGRRWGRGR
jgi:hypothetical protein